MVEFALQIGLQKLRGNDNGFQMDGLVKILAE